MVQFYRCKHCGNVAAKFVDSGVELVCCGEKMTALKANTTDAAVEKHVPDVSVTGNVVSVVVGSVVHPMSAEHYIAMIALETDKGVQIHTLKPTDEPRAVFAVAEGEKPVAVYEFCNLHGLWKKEL